MPSGRRHDDWRRESEWLGVWINEMHADYLAHDRLAEARARAARQTLVAELRAQQAETTRGWLARLAEALRTLTRWGAADGRIRSRPSRRWSHR